jgi:hypothetical protein
MATAKNTNIDLGVQIERQPDYTTCGPTALHAVYRYYGDPISLEAVIAETPKLPTGGTLGVHLSVHALRRGYDVTTWLCSVRHFDPTWFQQPTDLLAKLKARAAAKEHDTDARYGPAMQAVEQYLTLGGKVIWGDLTPDLIATTLAEGTPILTGTNGTYLYQCARETDDGPDDVRGEAFGHFIVIGGYRSKDGSAAIADPLLDNPAYGTKYYRAKIHRLIGAIFLGVGSDDGNLLVIRPKGWKKPAPKKRARTSRKASRPARKKARAARKGPQGARKRARGARKRARAAKRST